MVNLTNDYYSTSETASILHVSRITVFNWIKKKTIASKRFGNNHLISKEEVERLRDGTIIAEHDKSTLRAFVNTLIRDYGDFLTVVD